MSHFLTAVIVPPMPDEADILEKVTELLAPYDERGRWFRDGSRWDGWVIGGRWDGRVVGEQPELEDLDWPPTYSLERNAALVSFRDPAFAPGAIVTPDGEWHERAPMGWWGQPRGDEDDLWPARATELFDRYPDHLLVAVDCHV